MTVINGWVLMHNANAMSPLRGFVIDVDHAGNLGEYVLGTLFTILKYTLGEILRYRCVSAV